VGIAPVYAPGEAEEKIKILIADDRVYIHDQMAPSSLLTARKASRTRLMWPSVWVAI
jgi:hypothetical protein